jgi:hypothetical protein
MTNFIDKKCKLSENMICRLQILLGVCYGLFNKWGSAFKNCFRELITLKRWLHNTMCTLIKLCLSKKY